MRKRILVCLMIVVVVVAFMPVIAFAGPKTVKMTSYTVYKTGNTVYCAGDAGIYKVKVKKGKVISKKRLAKLRVGAYMENTLKKKGKYLYFFDYCHISADLKRVKIWGGKVRSIAWLDEAYDFVIKGNRIYYCDEENDGNMVMRLNGKGKKTTNISPMMDRKMSNKKGYKLITRTKGERSWDYLKTPRGTYYLGKGKYEDD